jgi:hypothetical protein
MGEIVSPLKRGHFSYKVTFSCIVWNHVEIKLFDFFQSELLEMFLIYLKDFEIEVDQLICLMDIFKVSYYIILFISTLDGCYFYFVTKETNAWVSANIL